MKHLEILIKRHTVVGCLAALVFVGLTGLAIYAINAAPDEHNATEVLKETPEVPNVYWSALSKTAMSITGDIRLSEDMLIFEDEQSIEIWEVDRSADASQILYEVISAANHPLLYENYLCDEKRPVDYILAKISDAGKSLMLTMIYDNTPYFLRAEPLMVEDVQDISSPFTGSVLGECAMYTYVKE